jgi:hypothetical protein
MDLPPQLGEPNISGWNTYWLATQNAEKDILLDTLQSYRRPVFF